MSTPVPVNLNPEQNHLIAALPDSIRTRLTQEMRVIKLGLGDVLYEADKVMPHVVFPVDAIVSLLYVTENGHSAETSLVGNEGVVGISLFMGGESTPSRAVVQSAGWGYKMSAKTVKEEFFRHSEFLSLLLCYTQSLITQMAQTAVCNRHHTVDQQLCRWLLLSLDRLYGNKLTMTQELIANMLGVRREGVTAAAGKLQSLGIISYSRGTITVLNRSKLEESCCECYKVVKKESDRLLNYLPNNIPKAAQ